MYFKNFWILITDILMEGLKALISNASSCIPTHLYHISTTHKNHEDESETPKVKETPKVEHWEINLKVRTAPKLFTQVLCSSSCVHHCNVSAIANWG